MTTDIRHNESLPQFKPFFENHSLTGGHIFSLYDFRVSVSTSKTLYWHYHPELELILFKNVSGVRIVGDSVMHFDRGDLCLIGSDTPHAFTITHRHTQKGRNIQVQFLPDRFGRHFLTLTEIRPLADLFERARRGLVFGGDTRRKAAEQLFAIADEKPPATQRFLRILSILTELAESRDAKPLMTTPTASSTNPRIERAINRVLQYVRANIDGDVARRPAAELIGMSQTAFSRFFRRHFEKTFVGFVNEMRIGKACMLLLETDQTVAEVAYACGFRNLSNFNQQFLRYKRKSPCEYRRQVRAEFGES